MFTEQIWQRRHSVKLKAGFTGAFLHVKLLWAPFGKSVPFLNLRVLRVFKKSQGWVVAAEYETAIVWRGSGSPYSFSSTAVLTERTGELAQRSLLRVAFLCSSRVHVVPALHTSRCYMEIFSPKMWDVVLLSQRSQWGGAELGLPTFRLQLENYCNEM